MSGKQSKRIRRSVNKKAGEIKAQAMLEFIDFVYEKGFWGRMRVGFRLVFKRIKREEMI